LKPLWPPPRTCRSLCPEPAGRRKKSQLRVLPASLSWEPTVGKPMALLPGGCRQWERKDLCRGSRRSQREAGAPDSKPASWTSMLASYSTLVACVGWAWWVDQP